MRKNYLALSTEIPLHYHMNRIPHEKPEPLVNPLRPAEEKKRGPTTCDKFCGTTLSNNSCCYWTDYFTLKLMSNLCSKCTDCCKDCCKEGGGLAEIMSALCELLCCQC